MLYPYGHMLLDHIYNPSICSIYAKRFHLRNPRCLTITSIYVVTQLHGVERQRLTFIQQWSSSPIIL